MWLWLYWFSDEGNPTPPSGCRSQASRGKTRKKQKSQHFPFKKEYKTMTFEVCGAGISKSAKTTKNRQKQQKNQKKSKTL